MAWRDCKTESARPWHVLLCAALLLIVAARGRGAGLETRDFAITIDNKPAGGYQLRIATAQDGAVTVRGQAYVDYRVLIVRYRYTYSGTEVWKTGRLLRLDSVSNDDGQRFSVHAQADGANLRVTVNGATRNIRGDVWTTSCWRLPPARFRNAALPLLDADTGQELRGEMQYIDRRRVTVAGTDIACSHYRVTGDRQLELYFDQNERLVRQETVERGHATVLQLTAVRR